MMQNIQTRSHNANGNYFITPSGRLNNAADAKSLLAQAKAGDRIVSCIFGQGVVHSPRALAVLEQAKVI